MKITVVESSSPEETHNLAMSIGSHCRGGEVFELISDLGGGKTAFTRGLASGMGSSDEVSSPSFTINNTYRASDLYIEHFDFYRLNDSGVVGEELREAIAQKDTVVVVEWGDIVRQSLGEQVIKVVIVPTSDSSRRFEFSYEDSYAYLFKEIL